MSVAPHQPQSNTIIPEGMTGPISSQGDARIGLGYGTLDPVFNKPRMYPGTFPFSPPDDASDVIPSEKDEETIDAISSKTDKFQKLDPLAAKGSDTLYFVGAASRLKSCFERPDEVLAEIETLFRSMSPIRPGPHKKTGTKKGWSSPPPATHAEYVSNDEEERVEDEFYSLLDLAMMQRPSLGECFLFEDDT